LLETLLAILIIQLTLGRIGENFVGFGEVLELFGGVRVVCILVCSPWSVLRSISEDGVIIDIPG
jgi:hypothetical protein